MSEIRNIYYINDKLISCDDEIKNLSIDKKLIENFSVAPNNFSKIFIQGIYEITANNINKLDKSILLNFKSAKQKNIILSKEENCHKKHLLAIGDDYLPIIKLDKYIFNLISPYHIFYDFFKKDEFVEDDFQIHSAINKNIIFYCLTKEQIEYLKAKNLDFKKFFHFTNYFTKITDFEKYFSQRPSFIKNIIKKKAKIIKTNKIAYEYFYSHKDLDKIFSIYKNIKSNSWQVEKENQKLFYNLLSHFLCNGLCFVSVLKTDDCYIAINIWFIQNEITLVKQIYNKEFKYLSPGTMLLFYDLYITFVIQKSIDKFKYINFGRGKISYKALWTDYKRDIYGIRFKQKNILNYLLNNINKLFPK